MVKFFFIIGLSYILFVSVLIHCDHTSEPKETAGAIRGTVFNGLSDEMTPVYPAYIFVEDSLWAITDSNGMYSIPSILEGTYDFICSSLYYLDDAEQIRVTGEQTTTHDFYLTPDSLTGVVFGEFQDLNIFQDSLASNSAIGEWDAEQVFNAVTGATIQSKTLDYLVPDRKVTMNDSLLAVSDAWAQYWFIVQQGTYYVKGACEGYEEIGQVIKVVPDTYHYYNFFLPREGAAKPVSK